MNYDKAELTAAFKREVYDKIDVENEDDFMDEDFRSLTIGWALAKDLTVEEAFDFASYIRYETDLG